MVLDATAFVEASALRPAPGVLRETRIKLTPLKEQHLGGHK